MKQFFFLLAFTFLLSSCQKEDDDRVNPAIPKWLEPRIEALENSEACFACSVTRYTYHDEFYYSVYCGHWSCVMCEVYDSDGNRIADEQQLDYQDFLENRTDETVVWNCPDE